MASSEHRGRGFLESLSTRLAKLDAKTMLFHYFPMAGIAGYGTLSVNVMNPSLMIRMSPTRDVTNILLGLSVAGSLLYVYDRPHLKSSPTTKRLIFSGFSAVVFNFGSVLVWAVLRSSTRSNCIATIIGLASGAGLIYVGHSYLQLVDQSTSKK